MHVRLRAVSWETGWARWEKKKQRTHKTNGRAVKLSNLLKEWQKKEKGKDAQAKKMKQKQNAENRRHVDRPNRGTENRDSIPGSIGQSRDRSDGGSSCWRRTKSSRERGYKYGHDLPLKPHSRPDAHVRSLQEGESLWLCLIRLMLAFPHSAALFGDYAIPEISI